MQRFNSIICRLAGHKYSHKADRAEGWSYVTESSCLQRRICTRCREAQERFQHLGLDWTLQKDSTCEELGRCTRCGTVVSIRYQHVFGAETQGSCGSPRRTCTKCGYVERHDHDYIEHSEGYSYSDGRNDSEGYIHYAVCSKCGNRIERGTSRFGVLDSD